eukprot:Rhum_TRINITY_DN14966_c3_g2::Rhum_TRINITY_DN14966_c3_g2_i1::g.129260::m.129260
MLPRVRLPNSRVYTQQPPGFWRGVWTFEGGNGQRPRRRRAALAGGHRCPRGLAPRRGRLRAPPRGVRPRRRPARPARAPRRQRRARRRRPTPGPPALLRGRLLRRRRCEALPRRLGGRRRARGRVRVRRGLGRGLLRGRVVHAAPQARAPRRVARAAGRVPRRRGREPAEEPGAVQGALPVHVAGVQLLRGAGDGVGPRRRRHEPLGRRPQRQLLLRRRRRRRRRRRARRSARRLPARRRSRAAVRVRRAEPRTAGARLQHPAPPPRRRVPARAAALLGCSSAGGLPTAALAARGSRTPSLVAVGPVPAAAVWQGAAGCAVRVGRRRAAAAAGVCARVAARGEAEGRGGSGGGEEGNGAEPGVGCAAGEGEAVEEASDSGGAACAAFGVCRPEEAAEGDAASVAGRRRTPCRRAASVVDSGIFLFLLSLFDCSHPLGTGQQACCTTIVEKIFFREETLGLSVPPTRDR